MIDRYTLPKMKKIWTDEAKFNAFLDVEKAATHAFALKGVVPMEDYIKIRDNASFSVSRILEIEAETKHDVIAFTRTVSESLGEEKKWVHYGLTSTDVVDTANGVLLKKANEILEEDLNKLLDVLAAKAKEYKDVPIIGRTHGMHAEITSFGLKYALWYDEIKRDLIRFKDARKDVEACKLSGAVGNYITTSIEIEEMVSKELGLNRAAISTQVLSRDRHAYYISVLALIASALEKMAMEIRNLSRQEVHEVEEGFSSKQKGSSAMPHKRNPIGSENICGCARVIKAYVNTALDDNILWHERDISHSSAERIILADSTELLDYMLNRFTKILLNLVVFEDKMKEDIYLTHGVIFSGAVLNYLVSKGWAREKAYDTIQPLTFKSFNEKVSFKELLLNANILDECEIDKLFDLNRYMENVENIFKSVGIN